MDWWIDNFLVRGILIPAIRNGTQRRKNITKQMVLGTWASKKSPTAELPATLTTRKHWKNQ